MKSVITKSILIISSLLVFIFTQSCENEEVVKFDNYFPIGRTSFLNNDYTVITNSEELTYETVYDACGGYWLKFNTEQLENSTEIIIKFKRTCINTEDFIDSANMERWLKASYYIDSDNEAIISKALELIEGMDSIMEKATVIQKFIAEDIEFNLDPHKPAHLKASTTLEDGTGICINRSRLFVALCRAAGVPSRSVWGLVDGSDGLYNHHHQWGDVCDENGQWHTCDFGNLNGFYNNYMGHLDLVYAAEENSTITGFTGWTSVLNDLEYQHNYPEAYTGSIPNFEMVSFNGPDSIVVECTIQL